MTGPLIELREESNGKLVLRGYASVSERWYPVGNMFEEKVNRGTWRRCLADGPDTVLVQDHDGLAFARTKTPSGTPTLLLSETDPGLFCEAFLDATAPRVQDLRSTSENAGLQMSVGFLCSEDRWTEDRSRRELLQASVHRGDVTVCNYGANESASATISARGEAGEAERRALAASLTGTRERRMCPMLDLRDTGASDEPRGRSQILVPRSALATARKPPRVTHSYIESAKAKRARYRRYPSESRALADLVLSPVGEDWEIDSVQDVHRAVEVAHAAGPDEDKIKAWIAKRAEDMGVPELVPAGWKGDWGAGRTRPGLDEPEPKPAADPAPSVGGQPQ